MDWENYKVNYKQKLGSRTKERKIKYEYTNFLIPHSKNQ